MEKNNELFTTMPVGKAIAKLAVPTVISQIIVILYNMADTFFIGQTGDPNQLTALSIAFPIFTLLTAVANLFGIGANSLIARSMGMNDEKTATKASSFCFWGSLGVTLVLAVILAFFMKPILTVLGADELTYEHTKNYLMYVFVIGGLPTVAGLALGHLVRAVGKTREAGIGLAIGGILNIILDPVFVLNLGMGVAGAAIATALSNTVSLIFLLVVLARIRKTTCLTINPKKFTFEKKVSLGTLSVGFPAAVSVLLVSFSISLLTSLLTRCNDRDITSLAVLQGVDLAEKYPDGIPTYGGILAAAYGVTAKCGTVALHIAIGIAQGIMPLIGYSYGAKNHKRVKEVTKLSFVILGIFSVLFLALVQFIPDTIVGLLSTDPATIEVGGTFIRCWSWCVVGMCLVAMYDAIFQAVGKWKTSLVVAVLRFCVVFPALCFGFNAAFGSNGLMWVQPITDTAALILAACLFERFKKGLAKSHEPQPVPIMSSNKIITISHEFGSGARQIGRETAEKLGVPCYDSDLIDKIALESGLAKEYIEKYGEYTQSDVLYENAMAVRDSSGQSPSDKLWLAQKQVVSDLAMKSSCVIVGRCADYILKDISECLTVFIHANGEERARRVAEDYGEKTTEKKLRDKDKKRAAYYELYTGIKWGAAENYELCLDSGKIGIDGCVDMIVDLYKKK